MFHISDVKKFVKCPKYYWLSKEDAASHYIKYVRLDETLSDLVSKKLGVKNAFVGHIGDDATKALLALEKYDWLIKARFEYETLRVKIPFLQKVEEGWIAYFINVSNLPKDVDNQYYSDNLWVLQQLNINIVDIKIVHLNEAYKRNGELDYKKLFKISDMFYNSKGTPSKPIYSTIIKKVKDISKTLYDMETLKQEDVESIKRSPKCTRKTKCIYYDTCFPNEVLIEDDSILNLVSSQYKYKMLSEGYDVLSNANLLEIEGSRQQYAQIMASRNGGLFIDRLALKSWMNDVMVQPVSFLDFEWDTYAIPPYDNMKPFDVLVFQYSLHVSDNDETLHYEYIGVEDCREELVVSLINSVPKTGSILAFNAEGAEKLRIKEMIEQFPQYKKELQSIITRMVDLSLPFNMGMVYDLKMRGLYSLKQILPIVDETLSYQNLDIHHGMEAVYNWRLLDESMDPLEYEEIKKQLLAYCLMDTLALKKLYDWLVNQVSKGE